MSLKHNLAKKDEESYEIAKYANITVPLSMYRM